MAYPDPGVNLTGTGGQHVQNGGVNMEKSVLQGKLEFEPMAGPEVRLEGLAQTVGEMQREAKSKYPGGWVAKNHQFLA